MNKLFAAAVIVAGFALAGAARAQVIAGPPDAGITYIKVDEAWTDLHANSRVRFSKARFSHWTIGKELGNGVTWAFSPEDHYAHPSVARQKWTEQDGRMGSQYDVLCEAEQPACDRLRAELPSLDTQMVPRSISDVLNGPYTVETFSKAVEIEPEYEPAYVARAGLYFDRGQFDRALADLSKVIELNPRSAVSYNDRCWVRAAAARDLWPALADCDSAVRLQPDDGNVRDSRGFIHLRLDLLDDAIADYDAALKITPKLPESLYGRGLNRHRKGDAAAGDADMAAAIAIQPSIAARFARYGLTK